MYPSISASIHIPAPEPVPDYSRQRASIRRLTDALYDYLALPYDEDEADVIATNAMTQRGPVISMDDVMRVQERIDALHEQVEAAKAQIEEAVKAVPEEMLGMFRLQLGGVMLTPLQQQIELQKSILSALQKQMESQSPLGGGTI